MAKFSERICITQKIESIQVDTISEELKNSIWNLFHNLYEHSHRNYWISVSKSVAQFFRKSPIDELPFRNYECRNWLKRYFYELRWYDVYNLVEFIVNDHEVMTRIPKDYGGYYFHPINKTKLIEIINHLFERELSGYRFISEILSPISEKAEVDEISMAISESEKMGLLGARKHILSALELLGKKPEPDYRNAIKEAISSVESIVKQITGSSSQGIAGALSELSKNAEIHGSLKSGFKKLYGYSSDEDGIRHAILDESNVGFTEAKYMIVSCSAFVNYLIAKADAAGLLKE